MRLDSKKVELVLGLANEAAHVLDADEADMLAIAHVRAWLDYRAKLLARRGRCPNCGLASRSGRHSCIDTSSP